MALRNLPEGKRLGDSLRALEDIQRRADLLIAGGSGAEVVVSAANRAGMPRTKSVAHRTPSEAAHEAALRIRPGDALLMTGQTLSPMQHTLKKQIVHFRSAA